MLVVGVFAALALSSPAAMNSVKCWEKLRTMGRQSDLHTFATRGHCFQFNGQPGTGSFTRMDHSGIFCCARGMRTKGMCVQVIETILLV